MTAVSGRERESKGNSPSMDAHPRQTCQKHWLPHRRSQPPSVGKGSSSPSTDGVTESALRTCWLSARTAAAWTIHAPSPKEDLSRQESLPGIVLDAVYSELGPVRTETQAGVKRPSIKPVSHLTAATTARASPRPPPHENTRPSINIYRDPLFPHDNPVTPDTPPFSRPYILHNTTPHPPTRPS